MTKSTVINQLTFWFLFPVTNCLFQVLCLCQQIGAWVLQPVTKQEFGSQAGHKAISFKQW